MVFEKSRMTKFVVVDTSAFIRNANLQEIGEKAFTVPEVVNEIKSKRQLKRLVVLPYDLEVKEAFPESISYVAEFSKKTGDFPSLSSTDLKVIALTYQLHKEHVGVENLRSVPEIRRSVDYCNFNIITVENLAGFYRPKKGQKSNVSDSIEVSDSDTAENENKLVEKVEKCNINDDESDYLSACSELSDSDEFLEMKDISNYNENDLQSNEISCENDSNIVKDENVKYFSDGVCVGGDYNDDNDDVSCNDLINNIFVKVQDGKKINDDNQIACESVEKSEYIDGDDESNEDNENYDEDNDDDDDDSDVGWITPGNIKQMKQEMDADNLEEKPVKVACLTTDFAMQNVLKQMGLNVLSLDGKLIKQMKTFILRCYSCFKTTSVMTKVFCHHCGNKTLKKVAVSLDADGNQKIHVNLRRPITARGKKFSLPKPTGGKHSNYPILFEDQPVPDQRPSRLARMKNNPLEPDYIAGYSPFVMRDVNSRSAMLGIPNKAKELKHWMKRNPNESLGRRKKKK